MEEEVIEKIINNKLVSFNMPQYEDLNSNIKRFLLIIESEIQNVYYEREQLIKKYKEIKINVFSIVKKIKIARATIYNNKDILEKYIQLSQKELEKSDIFNEINKEIKYKDDKISKLNGTISKLQYRDLKEQLYLDKIEELENDNNSLGDTLDQMNIKLNELSDENQLLKNKLAAYNKVIKLTTNGEQ